MRSCGNCGSAWRREGVGDVGCVPLRSRTMKPGRPLLRRLQAVLLLLVVVFLVWQVSLLGKVWWWRDHNPGETAFMTVRAGQRQTDGKAGLSAHPWRSYGQINPALKRAVVASEDARFVAHAGFDWDGMHFALQRDLQRGRPVAGGSTITQQLAKNLFLSERRSFLRKAEEALITVMIESLWSKHRILEVYLNVIEWGDGVFGCEAAAQHYFGVGAGQLSVEQAARLAAMIPAPRFFDRHRGSRMLARRTATILARLPSAVTP